MRLFTVCSIQLNKYMLRDERYTHSDQALLNRFYELSKQNRAESKCSYKLDIGKQRAVYSPHKDADKFFSALSLSRFIFPSFSSLCVEKENHDDVDFWVYSTYIITYWSGKYRMYRVKTWICELWIGFFSFVSVATAAVWKWRK